MGNFLLTRTAKLDNIAITLQFNVAGVSENKTLTARDELTLFSGRGL
jgi:hypothetical protein